MQLTGLEVAPNPEGIPFEISIRCYLDPAHKKPRTHPILLHPDWSVDTGHDLEAERFSVAFGGYLSCLALADKVVPAVRTYVLRQLRQELPEILLGVGGRWTVTKRVETCCAGSTSFGYAPEAAAHVRSARHVAAEFRARTTTVTSLGKKVLEAHGLRDPVRLPENAMQLVGRCVARPRDVVFLWEAGLTPETICAVHAQVSDGRPLSPSFYLGVLSKRPDLRWIHETTAQVPDRDVIDWLAWSETDLDRESPGLRGEWLRLGISRRDITALSGTAYRPADVRLLATSLGMTTTAAGATLSAWADSECFPPTADLIEAAIEADVGLSAVSKTTVDRLVALLKPHTITVTREQHAFALMLCGAPTVTAKIAVKVGSLRSEAITRGLQEWERERQRAWSPTRGTVRA